MKNRSFNRRRALKMCSASLVVGAASQSLPIAAKAANQGTLKINQGFKDFTHYCRIMSDLGGGTTYRYHAGKMLIVPAPRGLAEDFVDFVAVKQDRTRRLPNGDFHHAYKGVTMFTDMETGEVLSTFNNPVTGETNTVEPFTTSGGSVVYTPEGPYALRPGADPTVTPDIGMGPTQFDWDMAGDDVWITYPERFAIFDDNGQAIAADNSMYRYMANMAQLNDPSITSVDATMTWQTETGPWGWMNMPEDFTGHFIFGSMGRKYVSLDPVPDQYVQESEKRFPGHLMTPIDWDDFVIPNSRH